MRGRVNAIRTFKGLVADLRIYSLDEYFAKRLKEAPLEAKENVIAFYNKYGRYPNENELTE